MVELSVKSMTCNHCVGAVTRAVKALDADARVQVDLETKRVRVESRSGAAELAQAIDAAGYPAEPVA